ncbi:peamaclein-like [Andrographis paniculata]|uniref:peamaclein-like n=1 Tax=Andrographis paniculata TaxID=175694 RepID=UPI0021E87DD3|nr:peamaclein-like [Andrographis paniculata]
MPTSINQSTYSSFFFFFLPSPHQRMTKMKLLVVLLVALVLVLISSQAEAQTSSQLSSFCDQKCGERCAKAGAKDRCLKYCGICCEDCHCVPSGTYGNRHECPCYGDKLSSGGTPKCP